VPAVHVLLSESPRIKDPVNVGLQGAQGDVEVLEIRRRGRYSQRGASWTCRQGGSWFVARVHENDKKPRYLRFTGARCYCDHMLCCLEPFLPVCSTRRGGVARAVARLSQKVDKNTKIGVPDPPRMLPECIFVA